MSCCHYSYIVYKTFLKYLYTGIIDNTLSLRNLLSKSDYELIYCIMHISANYLFVTELVRLADSYFEENFKRDCTWMIRKEINASNVLLVYRKAVLYNNKVTDCFFFFFLSYGFL